MLPLHVYTDAPVLQPAPKYPDAPLRVVVLVRRSTQFGRSTDGIVWLPNEPALGAQRRHIVTTLLAADPQRDRLLRGLCAMAAAAARGPVELGIMADFDETLFGGPLVDDEDPLSRLLCTTLLHSASVRRPVDLVVVPHRDDEPANPVVLEQLMRIGQRANVPMIVGVPAYSVRTLVENPTYQNNRVRDHAGWMALVAGDLGSTDDTVVPAGPVSVAFALASTVIASMARNDFPNFIGRKTGGKVEGFRTLSDSPAAAPMFVDDTWLELGAAGFVPLRVDADGSLFFPAAPMVRHDVPLEHEIPLPNASIVNDPWVYAHADQLPWRMLIARMFSVLREARDALLQRDVHATPAAVCQEMEDQLGAYCATHGAVISPPIRSRRPFSEKSRIRLETTERGDLVSITLFPHRASTPREIFVASYALLARGPFTAGSGRYVVDIGEEVTKIEIGAE